MQTTTNDYNQAIYNGHRECVLLLTIGGESFTAADVQNLSIKFDANSESSFALGSVCSACLEFTTGIGSALNTKAASWWTSNAISVSMGIKTGENAGTPVYEYIPCGVFYVSERAKNDAKTYKITAMDAIWKLSGEITSESFSFPCTLGNVFETLCTAFGVTASQASFPNKSTTIAEGSLFSTTGTTVLGWIAQAAGCFARATRSGNVELSWYSDPDHELGDDDIYSIEVGEFISPAITKLTIRKEEGDLGVSTGTDGYTYYITDNPLLYETETAQNCLAGIFGNIQGFQSQTVSMDVRGNPAVEIGDILTITATNVGNLIQNSNESKAYVMHHSLTFNGGIHGQYSSDGEDPEEEAESEIATYIHVLENKSNVLTRTLDATVSTITEVSRKVDSIQVGAQNMLFDTNQASRKKLAGPADRALTLITGGASFTGVFCAISDPPQTNISNGIAVTVDSTAASSVYGIAFYSAADVGEELAITPMTSGENYVMSCYARLTSGSSARLYMRYDARIAGTSVSNSETTITGSEWVKAVWPFTFDMDAIDPNHTKSFEGARIWFGVYGSTSCTVELCGFQLEQGTLATSYEEHTGDLKSYTETCVSSSIEQTAGSIELIVSEVSGNKAEAEEGLEAAKEELKKLRKTVDDNKDAADSSFAGIGEWKDQLSLAVGRIGEATKYVTLDDADFLIIGMTESDFDVHVTNELVEIRNLKTQIAKFSTEGLLAPTITAQTTITLSPIQIKANEDLGWLLVKV